MATNRRMPSLLQVSKLLQTSQLPHLLTLRRIPRWQTSCKVWLECQTRWWWVSLELLATLRCQIWGKWRLINNNWLISPSWCTSISKSSIFNSSLSSSNWWCKDRVSQMVAKLPQDSPVWCPTWCLLTLARWDSQWCSPACQLSSNPWVRVTIIKWTTRESSEESCSYLSVKY